LPHPRHSSVTYPPGEVYRYTHDDTHHILSVTLPVDAASEPRMVLRNKYQNKMLTPHLPVPMELCGFWLFWQ
jgi:hypothetical protein